MSSPKQCSVDLLLLLTQLTNPSKVDLGEPGPAMDTDIIEVAGQTVVVSDQPVPRRPLPLPPPSTDTTQYILQQLRQPNNGRNNMAANSNAFPALDTSFSNRAAGGAGPQTNGTGMSNANNLQSYVPAAPLGHQQDLSYLFQQFAELQAQLASNRERVNDITRSAEEVARRANAASQDNMSTEDDQESDKSKIRDLEHAVSRLTRVVDLYKHEQRENTSLIAQYEDALGTATEQIRNYCNDIDSKFLAQRRHYNDLLQAEKDQHLQSRLEKDHWHSRTLEVCEWLRTANKMVNDEWCDDYRVVVELQCQVRCFRRVLGMEAEKPEDEAGWPYLKDAPWQDLA